jgi:hypothetical protein
MTNNTPDYEDNLYFDSQNTKKALYITVEKQVWESTLNRSMELQAENDKLKEHINHLLKTQARQFVDNQKLQVKAEKAKDVVNIDTARQIKQLKELLEECKTPLEVYNEMFGNKEELLTKIDEVLK